MWMNAEIQLRILKCGLYEAVLHINWWIILCSRCRSRHYFFFVFIPYPLLQSLFTYTHRLRLYQHIVVVRLCETFARCYLHFYSCLSRSPRLLSPVRCVLRGGRAFAENEMCMLCVSVELFVSLCSWHATFAAWVVPMLDRIVQAIACR